MKPEDAFPWLKWGEHLSGTKLQDSVATRCELVLQTKSEHATGTRESENSDKWRQTQVKQQ